MGSQGSRVALRFVIGSCLYIHQKGEIFCSTVTQLVFQFFRAHFSELAFLQPFATEAADSMGATEDQLDEFIPYDLPSISPQSLQTYDSAPDLMQHPSDLPILALPQCDVQRGSLPLH